MSSELPIALAPTAGCGLQCYSPEWSFVIKQLRNHPCVFAYTMDNEYTPLPFAPSLKSIATRLDPGRFVNTADGVADSPAVQTNPFDFFSVEIPPSVLPLGSAQMYQPKVHTDVPTIFHETGNYNTWPDLDRMISRWNTTDLRPYFLTGARERLGAIGLLAENTVWTNRSQALFLFCMKTTLEEVRKTSALSGTEWWLLSDYYGSSNGVFDSFFDSKLTSVGLEVVRRVHAPLLLLAALPGDTLNPAVVEGRTLKRAYIGGQAMNVSLFLSNFGVLHSESVGVRWTITADGPRTLCEGNATAAAASLPDGEPSFLGFAECMLPDLGTFGKGELPLTVTLSAELIGATGTELLAANAWRTRVYPRSDDSAALCSKGLPCAPAPGLRVAKKLTTELVLAVLNGTTVLVVAGSCTRNLTLTCLDDPLLSSLAGSMELGGFQPSSWDDGGATRSVGTVVYPAADKILAGTAPGRWLDEGWYDILMDSRNYVLNNHSAAEVLVRSIDYFGMARRPVVPNGGAVRGVRAFEGAPVADPRAPRQQ
eukprot:SAG22_NODE_429_length_10587_cov_22.842582_7_plen_538_part_00